jgi:hypothetical protein
MARRFIPPFEARRLYLSSLGLRYMVCPACGQCHPLAAKTMTTPGELVPEVCSNCGNPLPKGEI